MDLKNYWENLEDERKDTLLTHVKEMIAMNHGVMRFVFLRTNISGQDIRLRYDKSVDKFVSIHHRLESWDIPTESKPAATKKSDKKSVGTKPTKKKSSKKSTLKK